MSALACRACGTKFEASEAAPRCPNCLRKTSVVDPDAPPASAAVDARAPFSIGVFAARTALGSIMVLVLAGGMASRSSLLDTNGAHPGALFAALGGASIFGGVLLAIAWTLFPRTRMGGL